jgi:putative photosynthetic complex assembly protein 2
VGFLGVQYSLTGASVQAAYAGFVSALAIWGWVELSFLSGIITGPNQSPCPPAVREPERFVRAIGTIAWHELVLIALLGAIATMSRGAEQPVALWTFALLFAARISAKLNLFFGVPSINIDFLPSPLAHLPSHFRIARMNWVFPISVTGLAIAAWAFVGRLSDAPHDGAAAANALLTALTLLALLEHWFMVLPLPDDRLWRWMIPAAKPKTDDRLPLD